MVFMTLMGNIKLANQMYLYKNFQYDSALSYMTRVVYDIEKNDDYKTGDTKVAFIGRPTFIANENFDEIRRVTGMDLDWTLGASQSDYYEAYFENVLMIDVNVACDKTAEKYENDSRIDDMPVYPNKDSIQMVDDVLIVKLGNHELEN